MTLDLNWDEICEEGQKYLQKILTFDTTNPPGNETPALEYLAEILETEGIETQILESAPNRGNLVARLEGKGKKKPFLLASHIDVVPAEEDHWKYPPFSGACEEGCIWGRGAVDMKTMAIYEVMTMVAMKRLNLVPERDLILAVVADEEEGGDYGMKWLVKNHADLIRAEYSFNEVGGFSVEAGKKRLYPIQVAHKGAIWMKLTVKGSPGHGSMPREDNGIYTLSQVIDNLSKGFAMKSNPISKIFLKNLGQASGPGAKTLLNMLTWPWIGEKLLGVLPIDKRRYLSALLRNTITPTRLEGGGKTNVIPSEVSVTIDCRTLPGTGHSQFKKKIKSLAGEEVEVEILEEMEPYVVEDWDNEIYATIVENIEKADEKALVTPSLTVGFTDAKHLEPLEVKTYGFFPMKLPADFKFAELFHGHNERIPIESFQWGLKLFMETVWDVVGK